MNLAAEPNETTLGGMAFGLGIIALATVVVIVVIWQLAATYRAKTSVAREQAYRELAERATTVQENTRASLQDVQARLREIERIMREVE